MKELDDLLDVLDRWNVDINEGVSIIELSDAYRTYKAAPPPLVLEHCARSDSGTTILFLNQEIPVVVFEGIAYRLPEDKT